MQTQILGLLTPLMSLGFAATFGLLWWAGQLKRHVLGFGISYTLFSAGFLVTHLLPSDAWYLFHVTQALYSAAVIISVAALCDRVGIRIPWTAMVVITAISAGILSIAVSTSNDVAPRLIIVNNGYGAMLVVGVATLMSAPRRSLIDNAIIAMTAVQAADFLIRPNLSLMYESVIATQAYRDSVYYSLIGLVLGVKSVASAMLLVGATIFEWNTAVRESGERDDLTGLRNRAAFEDKVRTMMDKASNEEREVCLIVADIDHFKQVNDIWGHQAGDCALAGFGELIGTMVRESDVTGRIGGEEFCILVWDCGPGAAKRLAERVRRAFAGQRYDELPEDLRLTASFGVAVAHPGETYGRLFARADAALYEAKRNSRDCVVLYDEPAIEDGAPNLQRPPAYRQQDLDEGAQIVSMPTRKTV